MSDLGLRLVSFFGLFCMIGIAWVFSENRRRMPWRILLWGIGLQVSLGVIVLDTHAGNTLFTGVNRVFDVVTEASSEGAAFVFGNLSRLFVIERVLTPGRA